MKTSVSSDFNALIHFEMTTITSGLIYFTNIISTVSERVGNETVYKNFENRRQTHFCPVARLITHLVPAGELIMRWTYRANCRRSYDVYKSRNAKSNAKGGRSDLASKYYYYRVCHDTIISIRSEMPNRRL